MFTAVVKRPTIHRCALIRDAVSDMIAEGARQEHARGKRRSSSSGFESKAFGLGRFVIGLPMHNSWDPFARIHSRRFGPLSDSLALLRSETGTRSSPRFGAANVFIRRRFAMQSDAGFSGILATVVLALLSTVANAGVSDTSFTYQGQLKRGGVPVCETCEFGGARRRQPPRTHRAARSNVARKSTPYSPSRAPSTR